MAETKPELPKPSPPTLGLTKDDLKELLTTAIQAANAPSPEKAAEAAAEAERKKQRRANMERVVMAEQEGIARLQDACAHLKDDGTLAIGGQNFSNGRHIEFCLRCGKEMINRPTPEMAIAQTELQRLSNQGLLQVDKDGKVRITQPA